MFCSECGAKIVDGATFCTGCGARIGGNQEEKAATVAGLNDKNKRARSTIYRAQANQGRANAAIILGFVLVLIIGVVALFFMQYYNELSSRERESMNIGFILLAVLFVDGMGYALRGAYMKKAYVEVTNKGVMGSAVWSFPLMPIICKSIPFDISYDDIIDVSVGGGLVITRNGGRLSIPLSANEAIYVRNLVIEERGKEI